MTPLLEVTGLAIDYGRLRVVDKVGFSARKGEILGLVGESGSGKSSVLHALMGHVKAGGTIAAGRIAFDGQDLRTLSPAALRAIRGRRIGFVPQNPTTSLTPHLRIGDQMCELLRQHGITARTEAAAGIVADYLGRVGLPQVRDLMRRYPHELSGGQQQRVCIAMALVCRPEIVLMDEPTTGLDVTTQAQIVALLLELRREFGMSIIYVSHDLALLSQLADRVGVMYAGRLVEIGPTAALFRTPLHPYTRGLIGSIPSLESRIDPDEALQGLLRRADLPPGCPFAPRCRFAAPDCAQRDQVLSGATPERAVACARWHDLPAIPPRPAIVHDRPAEEGRDIVLRLDNLAVDPRPGGFRAGLRPIVPGVDLTLHRGEMLALVGESGSGKTTIAKAIGGLFPARGRMVLNGDDIPLPLRRRSATQKRDIQYIFQNPDASLNPRLSIWRSLSRPLRIYFHLGRQAITAAVRGTLSDVKLDETYAGRLPRHLSGGEKQRVAIARGLIAQPSVLLCDEVLSALDVSVQANIIELIRDLRRTRDLSILFISHDLAVVREISDRVAVLFHGEVMQTGPTASLFAAPYHPYTQELLSAVPEPGRPAPAGAAPIPERLSDAEAARGCVFRARCGRKLGPVCDSIAPPWREAANGSRIRCHHLLDG